jgi:predicted nuclease of predicted toxin-antitoxin system
MRFLIDAQLRPALTRSLSGQGHEAEHVADRGTQAASDGAISGLRVATRRRDRRQRRGFRGARRLADAGPAVIWIRLPNTRRRDLLVWFAAVLPDLLAALERGETLIEVT